MTKEEIRRILATHQCQRITDKRLLPAAVLVPLFLQEGDWRIVLTQRSQKVQHHKGQVSFPGGRRSATDKDLLSTALRESREEIGLKTADVEILGQLDDIRTHTGFVVTPFVGVIPYPYAFKMQRHETDEIFSAPLSSLVEKDNFRVDCNLRIASEDFGPGDIMGSFYHYQGKIIWGATARIITHFLQLLYPAFTPNLSA
ncbi:MAG: CoA pyrophosphatase [Chloroflexota bacterium]